MDHPRNELSAGGVVMSNYGDQFMTCPECGGRAESDAVDVGVGLYIAGNTDG